MDHKETVSLRHLSSLTPAETVYLLNGEDSAMSDLLKYTFIDLVLKQVLFIRNVEREIGRRRELRTYQYVCPGPNFGTHQRAEHERVFLSLYDADPDGCIWFRHLVKSAFENAGDRGRFYELLANSKHLKDVLRASLFEKFTRQFPHSDAAIRLQKEVQEEIAFLEAKLPQTIRIDRNEGLQILKQIGGNLFLLKRIDMELLKEFESMAKTRDASGDAFGCWVYVGDFSDSFDHSSDGADFGCGGGDGCGGCGGD